MAIFDQFPFTIYHELNLDQFFEAFKKLQDEWDNFGYSVTATAHAGLQPSVTVTGDLTSGLNFDFTLVAGDKGDTGDTGDTGNGISSVTFSNYQLTLNFTDGTSYTTPSLRGATGAGLMILDEYATLAALQAAHPSGNAGDMYLVGTSPNFTLYIWSTANAAWVDGGSLTSPSPSATTPLMNGIADTGVENAYARGDHVHPTDTSRAAKSVVDDLSSTVQGHDDDIADLQGLMTTAGNNILALQTGKQDTLVSQSNIKSVANQSLLGSGNLTLYTLLANGITEWVTDTQTSSSTGAVERTFTVDADCILLISACITSDSTSAAGYAVANIFSAERGGNCRGYAGMDTAAARSISANAITVLNLLAGDTVTVSLRCTKTGTKTLYYNYLCVGATLSE